MIGKFVCAYAPRVSALAAVRLGPAPTACALLDDYAGAKQISRAPSDYPNAFFVLTSTATAPR